MIKSDLSKPMLKKLVLDGYRIVQLHLSAIAYANCSMTVILHPYPYPVDSSSLLSSSSARLGLSF